MRSLAEMVSVIPMSGALMEFPHTFVNPALGFAVGMTYWFVLEVKKIVLTQLILLKGSLNA